MDSAINHFKGLFSLLICCVLLGTVPVSVMAETETETETAAEAAKAVIEAAAEVAIAAVKAAATGENTGENTGDDDKSKDICTIKAIDDAFEAYKSKISDEQIKRIQLLLRVFGYDPGEIDGLVGDDTDKALARLCLDYKADEYLTGNEQSKDDPSKYLAAHLISLLEKPGPIQQKGDKCGCSRDFSAMVYGFYPYLLARSEEQDIDFSLFDRIGFNMQVLDKDGNIPHRLQWSDKNDSGKHIASFISKAHKHRVKVDVTFYALEWQDWKDEDEDKAMINAVNNIVETASQEFHESGAKWWRKVFTQHVDGINLYFDNYTRADSSSVLVKIVQTLAEELENIDSAVELNIILGLDPSGFNKDLLTRLKNILVGDEAVVDKVFIFLPENTSKEQKNTSQAKKALRQKVENAFSGNNRAKVLRKIIPIITPAKSDFDRLPNNDEEDSQFDDDLIYLKDNFAGVGLWPLTPKSDGEIDAKSIDDALNDHYQADDGLNDLGELLDDYAPWLCNVVCPNRIYVYLGLALLVGILVAYALLALWNCRLREIYRQYFFYFLTLFLFITLILVVSLVCDPYWEKQVDNIVIGILLLAIAGIGWRSIRKAVQPPLP